MRLFAVVKRGAPGWFGSYMWTTDFRCAVEQQKVAGDEFVIISIDAAIHEPDQDGKYRIGV